MAELSGQAGALAGDGRLLSLAGNDGAIRLMVPESGRELARLEPPESDRVGEMAFTPDGARLAVAYPLAKHIKVWDLRRIRRQLADLGLDWEAPPDAPEEEHARPLNVRVVGAAQAAPGDRARGGPPVMRDRALA